MRFTAYPKYKPSGVEWLGEVPEHWDVKRLKMAATLTDKKVEADEENPVPYIGMENIESRTGRLLGINPDVVPTGTANEFNAGSTLFGKLRPYLAKACNPDFDGLCSTELLVLRGADLDRRALLYSLLADGFIKLVDSSTYGSKMPRASWEFIGDCEIPVASPNEQRAIADFLDRETAKIDTLVAKKRLMIERLKEKRTALISRTVTRGLPPYAARAVGLDPHPKLKPSGIDWLGGVPEHWKVGKFSREVQIAEGQAAPEIEPYSSMLLVAPNHIESGTGRLLAKETAADQGAISGKYLCNAGEVIYSKIRPALAKAVLAPEDCLCSADMYPMTSTGRLRSPYLLLVLLSSQFTAWSVLEADRVAMPKVNRETLSELRLPIPPSNEQDAIADFLGYETGKIDGMVSKIETAIQRLQEYRTALITAAVTGKIDVRALSGADATGAMTA
jgi:restriction endonuclease S subunit